MSFSDLRFGLTRLANSFCDDGLVRSVLLSDTDGHVQVRYNPDQLYPPASLIKVLIAETAIHLGIDLASLVPVSDLHATMYPTLLNALDEHRQLSVGEILSFSLVTSDNASADYLLELVGIDRVNKRAAELGLSHTHLATGFRDDEFCRGRESSISASDMSRLLLHVFAQRHREGYNRIWTSLLNNLRNTRIPGLLPDELAIAHKTGSLDGVAHDAGILLVPNMAIVMVILTEQEPSTLRTSFEMALFARSVYDVISDAEATKCK